MYQTILVLQALSLKITKHTEVNYEVYATTRVTLKFETYFAKGSKNI